jgi:hypothetical protein
MPTLTIATEAAYFQYGLEVGLVSEREARSWAFMLIEALDSPPYEAIAVAESYDSHSLYKALSTILGERDLQQAGKWLLGQIRILFANSALTPKIAVKAALQVATSTKLDSSIYYEFDLIGDRLYLAETEQYGTVAECIADLVSALNIYEPFTPNIKQPD